LDEFFPGPVADAEGSDEEPGALVPRGRRHDSFAASYQSTVDALRGADADHTHPGERDEDDEDDVSVQTFGSGIRSLPSLHSAAVFGEMGMRPMQVRPSPFFTTPIWAFI
jgi:hypothetical protein